MNHHSLIFNVNEKTYSSRTQGAHRIATWLRQHDFDVEVIDWVNQWSLAELIELFKCRYSSHTKFIGFSHMFSIWNETLEIFCQWIKKNYPEVPIISGSSVHPHFESQYIDFYVQGFGEHGLLELLNWLISNGKRPKFDLQKVNGKLIIKANDLYKAYPMKSLMIKYEDRDFIEETEWLGIETARGCKFKCSFCNFPVIGVKGDYSRDADDFEMQLRDTYDRFGVKNYMIADETFNDRTEKISKFADVIDKLEFTPYFSAYIRADLMISREKDKEELLRMNVLGHYYGIESLNTKSAKAVGKGMDSEKIKQGLIDAKKYFMHHGNNLYRGVTSFIVGLPYETFDSLENTRQWLLDHWQEQAFNVFALAIPHGGVTKSSEFSLNYKDYGYHELPYQQLVQSQMNNRLGNCWPWQNENMNLIQARKIVDEWVSMKYNHDFRPDNFQLGERTTKYHDLQDRLKLNYHTFTKHRNLSISNYIKSKLNFR